MTVWAVDGIAELGVLTKQTNIAVAKNAFNLHICCLP
jgi:hypothetical protein